MPFAFIKFVSPGHPDQGLPGIPGSPDQGLPGEPGAPDQGLPGGPEYPSQGPIWGRPPRPWPPLPPPRPWPPTPWPPTPVDPDWGIDAGVAPGQPIYLPVGPDQGLPPSAGHLPAPNPPPGTVWPPIAGAPEGKTALLVWLIGVGWRYVVVDLAPPAPSQNPIPTPSPTT